MGLNLSRFQLSFGQIDEEVWLVKKIHFKNSLLLMQLKCILVIWFEKNDSRCTSSLQLMQQSRKVFCKLKR